VSPGALRRRRLRPLPHPHAGDPAVLKIIRQLLDRGMPEGPSSPTTRTSPAAQEACIQPDEAMILHFKLIMDGIQVPAGEVLLDGRRGRTASSASIPSATGAPRPYRIRCGPLFPDLLGFLRLITAARSPTHIVSWGGLNVIAGELER